MFYRKYVWIAVLLLLFGLVGCGENLNESDSPLTLQQQRMEENRALSIEVRLATSYAEADSLYQLMDFNLPGSTPLLEFALADMAIVAHESWASMEDIFRECNIYQWRSAKVKELKIGVLACMLLHDFEDQQPFDRADYVYRMALESPTLQLAALELMEQTWLTPAEHQQYQDASKLFESVVTLSLQMGEWIYDLDLFDLGGHWSMDYGLDDDF